MDVKCADLSFLKIRFLFRKLLFSNTYLTREEILPKIRDASPDNPSAIVGNLPDLTADL